MLCALRRLYEDWLSTIGGIKEQRYKGDRLLGRPNVRLLICMHFVEVIGRPRLEHVSNLVSLIC